MSPTGTLRPVEPVSASPQGPQGPLPAEPHRSAPALSQPWVYRLLESGMVPEAAIRWGIRRLLTVKAHTEMRPDVEDWQDARNRFLDELRAAPIAIETQAANDQHYEVPAAFFQLVLGPRMKYSSGLWTPGVQTLAQSEDAMLRLTCERAQVQDGQRILDLGCGWGSLSLWLAEHYPNAQITALSNSASQRAFIERRRDARGFQNLQVITANIAEFEADHAFDRILSVEMFEHMKNYERLLAKLRGWLAADGRLFVHHFSHRTASYHYEDPDGTDWLTRYFFTGGTMPAHDLLLNFSRDLRVVGHWAVSGTHYQKTSEAWLQNQYAQRDAVRQVLADTYGSTEVTRWWVRWQVFFLACAELWGFRNGNEWLVTHLLFAP